MITLNETKNLTMWTCGKYGVSMLAAGAADFCAHRFAAANRKGGATVIGFSHCRTCLRGANLYKLVGARRGMVPPKKEFITW